MPHCGDNLPRNNTSQVLGSLYGVIVCNGVSARGNRHYASDFSPFVTRSHERKYTVRFKDTSTKHTTESNSAMQENAVELSDLESRLPNVSRVCSYSRARGVSLQGSQPPN
jgi:hypothetical protein